MGDVLDHPKLIDACHSTGSRKGPGRAGAPSVVRVGQSSSINWPDSEGAAPRPGAPDRCLAPTAPEHGWGPRGSEEQGPDASAHTTFTLATPPRARALTETTPYRPSQHLGTQ